jgi:hypothetical protein
MFIGHFGLGLGAKKAAPTVSLGTLFMAVQFLDLLWPICLLLNVEHVAIHPELGGNRTFEFTSYPITHSLLMAIVWGIVFGGVYFLVKRNVRNSILLGLAVLSHWVLDLVVHFHDLPLYPGNSPLVGLGVWANPLLTNIIEGAMLVVGIILYLRTAHPRKVVFWVLIALLLLVQVSNMFGPAPSSVEAVGWAGQAQWLFVALAYWADRKVAPAAR